MTQAPGITVERRTEQARQAVLVWCVFLGVITAVNAGPLLLFGVDLHSWTRSATKAILVGLLLYAILCLAVPLVIDQGWQVIRRPAVAGPVLLAIAAIAANHALPGTTAVVVAVLAYLHRRLDLSGLGIRSRGWAGDAAAVLLMGGLGLVPVLVGASTASVAVGPAVAAGLTRLLANPASTVENLFYFGFLTERLAPRCRRWTPLLIAAMYTTHEMTNPEYWYARMNFPLVFVGIAIWVAVYQWRRSTIVIWLGDGLYRLVGAL